MLMQGLEQQQKNNTDNMQEKHTEVHIYGVGVLDLLKEVINSQLKY